MNSVVKFLALFFCATLPPSASFAQTALVNASDTWRYHKGTNAPQANWRTISDAALNADWGSGPGGFGYADNDDGTVLNDMMNRYVTVYARRTFNVAGPLDPNLVLRLVVDYDDAYVACLDGQEIARSPNIVNGVVGVEPAFTNRASSTHEASGGGTGASPPVTTDLGNAAARLAPGNHVLALIGLNESSGSSDFSLIPSLLLVDPSQCPANTICADTNWVVAGSPYTVNATLVVNAGATLTIEPGVTVLFGPGAGIRVNGRLVAEGSPQNRIVFTRSESSGTWSHIYFAASATTSTVAHAEMSYFASAALEAHDTALHVDDVLWINSTAPVVDMHNSSIVLLNSVIPGGAGNEPVHFSGMPANGHALIKGCTFGAPQGYNDSIDFTGGNRPGPIAQFIDNVFLAAVDDCFDMDATDAHIEGNIFLNVKQDAQRDSSSNPITTGEGNGISELVIARNLFFNCEHTLLLKDNGAAVMQNNTIVNLTTNALARTAAGNPIPPGIILFGEPWRGRPYGGGAIYDGNIAHRLDPAIQANPFPLFDPANSFFVVSHSLTQGTNWPGLGNISTDPMFVNLGGPMTAANIRGNLALLAGSPCIGTGPNGIDMGALVPPGASLGGVPSGTTTNTSATLKVGGPGIWAYKWRLNGGAWSQEISLVPQSAWNGQPFTAGMFSNAPPILLTGLTNGSYTVEVIGRNSAGFWQNESTAASKTWMVQTSVPLYLGNAILVGNDLSFTFTAQAGQTYSVLYRDALDDTHPWTKLANIPAQPSNGPFTFTDTSTTSPRRFYQVVWPAQP